MDTQAKDIDGPSGDARGLEETQGAQGYYALEQLSDLAKSINLFTDALAAYRAQVEQLLSSGKNEAAYEIFRVMEQERKSLVACLVISSAAEALPETAFRLGCLIVNLAGSRIRAVTLCPRSSASFRMAEPTNPLAPINSIFFMFSVCYVEVEVLKRKLPGCYPQRCCHPCVIVLNFVRRK